MNKAITNRYEELTPIQRILIDHLVNAVAACDPVDDLVLHQWVREGQIKLHKGPNSCRVTRS